MGNSACRRPRASFARNESGAVLVTTLLTILLLTAMGNVVMNTSIIETMMSNNYRTAAKALYIAEAGLQHGIGVLNSTGGAVDGFDDEIGTTIASDTDFAGGSYTVTVADNDDGDFNTNVDSDDTIVLTAIGINSGGRRTIVSVVFRTTYTGQSAFTTNGNLTISGNPTISGTNGSVHSNGDLAITGTPTISQGASATGTGTGGATSGADAQFVPTIIVSDYESYADYKLQSDGLVKIMATSAIENPADTGGKWNGWDFSAPKWTFSGSSTIDGMFYIDGDAVISSSPNNWTTTFVATGYIEISGTPEILNYKDSNDPVGVQNLLFVAGTDLKINGNASQSFEGVMAAKEQLQVSGNPALNGAIIVEDASATSGLVTTTEISGSMSITYTGGLVTSFNGNMVSIRSWREVTS